MNSQHADLDAVAVAVHDLFDLASIHMSKEWLKEGEELMSAKQNPGILRRLKIMAIMAAKDGDAWTRQKQPFSHLAPLTSGSNGSST